MKILCEAVYTHQKAEEVHLIYDKLIMDSIESYFLKLFVFIVVNLLFFL